MYLNKCYDTGKYIVKINLAELKGASVVETGVAINKCQNCDAYLSNISKVEEAEDKNYKFWKSEFCDFINHFEIKNKDFPKNDDLTYIHPSKLASLATEQIHSSENFIFCVDISNNMIETTNINGNRVTNLKADIYNEILNDLSILADYYPEKKVSLVTFNDEVHSYNSSQDVIISDQYLDTKLGIMVKANLTGKLETIEDTLSVIKDKLLK
jgi:hypothetical protein